MLAPVKGRPEVHEIAPNGNDREKSDVPDDWPFISCFPRIKSQGAKDHRSDDDRDELSHKNPLKLVTINYWILQYSSHCLVSTYSTSKSMDYPMEGIKPSKLW